jgi:hypothetical protein
LAKDDGSPDWTRTSDKLINSQLLYQLSYRGTRSFLENTYIQVTRTLVEQKG